MKPRIIFPALKVPGVWIDIENALFGERTERETEFEATRAKCEQLEHEVNDAQLDLGEKAEDIARIKKRAGAADVGQGL